MEWGGFRLVVCDHKEASPNRRRVPCCCSLSAQKRNVHHSNYCIEIVSRSLPEEYICTVNERSQCYSVVFNSGYNLNIRPALIFTSSENGSSIKLVKSKTSGNSSLDIY